MAPRREDAKGIKRLRVLYDHQIFSVQEYGGISRYFWELMKGISALSPGADLSVFAPLYLNRYLSHQGGVRVRGARSPKFPGAERFLGALNQAATFTSLRGLRPDVLHETYYYYSQRARMPRHARTVITIHDMIPEKWPKFFPPNDPTPAQKARAVRNADHVICVSRQTQSDLVEILGVPPEKTSVIYLGADMPAPEGASAAPAAELPANYILYVGPRGGYKNFEALALAYARSSRLRENFSLVCVGGEPLTAAEASRLEKLGVAEEKRHFLSADDAHLAELYRNAKVFVYTSLYEGFGMPPLEAMRAGCPVVSSLGGSLGEIVGAGVEPFEPTRPESLLAALEKVLFSADARRELSVRGGRHAEQFRWEDCARQTLALYRHVAGKS